MSASFSGVGRAQLAGYAGTASGILRSRIHPLVPIAAIDVLAVAVALGAMNLVGTIVSGQRENPFLAAIDRTKDDFTIFAARAPTPAPVVPRAAPTVSKVLAAIPDAELLFGRPVLIGTPFEAGQADTIRFISPMDAAAANTNDPTTGGTEPATNEESEPTNVAAVEKPALPLTKYSRTTVSDAATSAVGAVEPVATTATAAVAAAVAAPVQTVAAPAQAAAAPVQNVAAPVQQAAQSVMQPVTKIVGGVAGLLN